MPDHSFNRSKKYCHSREIGGQIVLYALVGNQNCGKTTLFNRLTGSNQHVGNFPGVTVEKKEGVITGYNEDTLVDLPGIYSLSPYTAEEIVTRDFILNQKPDLLINIVDATAIERSLYLTMQLSYLNRPMVIALNMMDELSESGGEVDCQKLSQQLGIGVVPISALKGEGIKELLDIAQRQAKVQQVHCNPFLYSDVQKVWKKISQTVRSEADAIGWPAEFAALKLLEGDKMDALQLNPQKRQILKGEIQGLESTYGMDQEALMADMRYRQIEDICRETVIHPEKTKKQMRSDAIDRLLTHPVIGIPIFFCFLSLIFYITFGSAGMTMKNFLEMAIGRMTNLFTHLLEGLGVSVFLNHLLIEGVFAGVGSVLSFLPVIVVLFFFLSILEDSGYLARASFLMDGFLRRIGLSGRSFVPMLLGFGCSVPAIMASRTLSGTRERKLTVLLTPFLSCSAKLPVYGMIASVFFPDQTGFVVVCIYGIGVLAAIMTATMIKSLISSWEEPTFVMELPVYRIPVADNIVRLIWEKVKDFVKKAFTIIFLGSIFIWFMQYYTPAFQPASNPRQSILAWIGSAFAPIFMPAGFGDYRAVAAILTGLTAKETVVSTLTILLGGKDGSLYALQELFTVPSALSFLTFIALYMPCIAAFAAEKRELGWKTAIKFCLYQTVIAYFFAIIVYRLAVCFIG